MNFPLLLAAAYLAQLGVKAGLALRQRAREAPAAPANLARMTVLQPVVSGDPNLGPVLTENLRELRGAAMIWVIDQTDPAARELCAGLQAAHPGQNIRILETAEPPAGRNPKLWKQAEALPLVQTELLAIVDDDTRVPRSSLDQLVSQLDAGADLATGLPSYLPAPGIWSRLVAEFVNSSAILTYLSAAACTEPLSINGMCYALRTDFARERDLFTACGRAVTDDLALAKEVRRGGGRLWQTTRPQHIGTLVADAAHYRRLMHRWFVFTRILVQNESPRNRVLIVGAYGLHPLVLAALGAAAIVQPATALVLLLAVVLVRALTLGLLNRRFTGEWRHAPVASLLAELLQPVFLLGALFQPVIWWRRRRILVRNFNDFEYLSP